MQELVFVIVFLVASAFSALQIFAHRGGVLGAIAALVLWIPVYYGSTAVQTVSSGVVVELSNPMVQWVAVLMAVLQFVVLLFVLVGVGPWAEEQPDDEGLAGAVESMQGDL